MYFKKINKNNSALAGVIEALLLVGLVAIILSIIQLNYVPEIMRQKESDHMDVVENQFSNLKSVIEIQSMMGVTESDTPIAYSPMSSLLTLGSSELPYFISSKSYGDLNIIDMDSTDDNKINIQPMTISEYSSGIPLTSIVYSAQNAYIDDRNYILEGGGIILNQNSGGNSIPVGRVRPAITVQNKSEDGYIKIYYTIPVFVVHGEKRSASGYKDTYIRTNYSNHDTHTGTATIIKILSENLEAWEDFISDEATGMLWEYDNIGYISISIDNYDDLDPSSPLCIKIEPNSKDIRVDVTVIKIGIQVGPGIV